MSINSETIQISAKTLGELAMPDFCPRCFWIKLNCKLPYQIFPGIFSSIDSYSKKITWGYFEKFGKLPDWFNSLGDLERPIKAPGRSIFFYMDKATNIKLTGTPDEILQKKDGSYCIIDYKTARFTGKQDELLPMYEVQLNSYALIANNCNLKPVNGLGLLYYEPQTDITPDDLKSALLNEGFNMPFKAYLLEIELNPEKIILPLLVKARKIADMKTSPDGSTGCEDCWKLSAITQSIGR